MGEPEDSPPTSVDQLADEIQMLGEVCRLIAGRTSDADLAEELADLANSLDREVDRLRIALQRLGT
jgi:hypothetical protein